MDKRQFRTGPHLIETDGIRLRYHVRGSGSEVCVALPGGPGLWWDYLRMPEVERAMRVVYLEPLGTGGSGRLTTHPHGYTRDRHVRALDDLLDHLGSETVHLLGHGSGGHVAQRYALRRPERLAGLILYGSSPVMGPEHADETRRQLDRFLRRNQWQPKLPAVLAAAHGLSGLKGYSELTATMRRALPAYLAHYWARREELAPLRDRLHMSYVTGLDADGREDQVDDLTHLSDIEVPTLVVAGAHDIVGGVRWGRELRSLIPYAQLSVLPSSGHFGHVEEPERFAEAVLDFVASGPDPRRVLAPTKLLTVM